VRLGSATTRTIATRARKRCTSSNRSSRTRKKRKKLVWEIDKKLTEDAARPIVWRYRPRHLLVSAGARHHDQVNSIFNGWRLEEAWLDK